MQASAIDRLFGGQEKGARQEIQHKRSRTHRTATSKRPLLLVTLTLCCCLQACHQNHMQARADDSAAPPAPFDLSALASLASNLGSNPQIMSMVSSLLTQGAPPRPSGQASDLAPLSGNPNDQDPNSMGPQDDSVALRRSARQESPNNAQQVRQQPQSPAQQQQALPLAAAPAQAQPQEPAAASPSAQAAVAAQNSSPLSGILSMVPNMLSSLSGGGGGGGGPLASLAGSLGPLGNLLGLGKPSATSSQAQTQSGAGASRADPVDAANRQALSSGAGAMQMPPPPPPPLPLAQPPPSLGGANPAQSVINQVLTAYAAGQIPNELIQLGLSGRVPPQIIELALSGQVPPQIIQMVITGQVPMSTINTFLSTMQANGSGGGASPAATTAAAASTANGPATRTTGGGGSSRASFGEGLTTNVFSTTKNLFESLFGLARLRGNGDAAQRSQQQQGITVPTLLGPIPLRVPSLPNMRSLGQLVGGTISNVASMIPF